MLRSLRKKRRNKEPSHQGRVGGFSVSWVMLAVSIAVLTACVTTPTGRSALRLYSEKFMAEMGQASFQRIKESKSLIRHTLLILMCAVYPTV